jgi:hypothetical protein
VAFPLTVSLAIFELGVPLGTVTTIVRFSVFEAVTLNESGSIVVGHPVDVNAEREMDTGSPFGSLTVARALKVAVPPSVAVMGTSMDCGFNAAIENVRFGFCAVTGDGTVTGPKIETVSNNRTVMILGNGVIDDI